jgi:hypothetical protein
MEGSEMPKKKQIRDRPLLRQVPKACGGINYASNVLAEEGRARINRMERVIRIVKTYLGSAAHVTDSQAITDLLADLRHICDYKGLAFQELERAAEELYEDENTDHGEWPSPFRDLKNVSLGSES